MDMDDGRCCYAVKLGFGCPSLSLAPSSNKNCDFFQCPCVPCVGSVCVCGGGGGLLAEGHAKRQENTLRGENFMQRVEKKQLPAGTAFPTSRWSRREKK